MGKIGRRIKAQREQHGLSQRQLADILGVSRPAVSEIENDSRKVSAEELVKLSRVLAVTVDFLLGLESKPEVVLEKPIMKRERTASNIRIDVPQRNVEKFKEVFLYILNKIGAKPNIGETVIYKLLYFIDFDFYEKYEEQLIGATYQKNLHGPTPLEFQKIVDRMIRDNEVMKVGGSYFQYPQKKYLPLRPPKLSKLSGQEIELINDVLNRLSDMNATQISEHSHKDVPWLTTENGKVIPYEAVFYRTPDYSVRESDDDEVS